ncbi:hypothetical protein LZ30DRAFT_706638 [Colletotrichum cereale]|nr:hypothetical protein LZ30DRAFT_706638 [Colletotrichum cereale]
MHLDRVKRLNASSTRLVPTRKSRGTSVFASNDWETGVLCFPEHPLASHIKSQLDHVRIHHRECLWRVNGNETHHIEQARVSGNNRSIVVQSLIVHAASSSRQAAGISDSKDCSKVTREVCC